MSEKDLNMMPCSQCLDEPCSCARGGRAQFERDSGLKPRERVYVCPKCGAISHNPTDELEGYCAQCHDWTATVTVGRRDLGVLLDTYQAPDDNVDGRYAAWSRLNRALGRTTLDLHVFHDMSKVSEENLKSHLRNYHGLDTNRLVHGLEGLRELHTKLGHAR